MSDLLNLPLSEILALAGRAQAAERRLADAARALGDPAAPSETPPRPARKARQEKPVKPARVVPLNRGGKPRPSCSVCGVADGTVSWKRCKKCREAGKGAPAGAPRGTGKKARAKAAPVVRKIKLSKGDKTLAPAPADGPRCDGAWMARARMKFKQQPAVEFLPGVQTVLKRCAAGDWPLLSEVPAVIR